MAIDRQVTDTAHRLMPRLWVFIWLGLGLLIPGLLVPDGTISLGFTVISVTLFSLAFLVVGLNRRYLASARHLHDSLDMFIQNDSAPTICTTDDGHITYANKAARARFGDVQDASLVLALAKYAANPVNVIFRLQRKARMVNAAQEDMVTARGHLRLSVHFVDQSTFIWRLEDLVELDGTAQDSAGPVGFPMLLANEEGRILFSNAALFMLVGSRFTHLDRLFADLPLRTNGLHQLQTPEGPELVRVLENIRENGRREILLVPCDPEEVSGSASGRLLEDLPIAMLKLTASGTVQTSNRAARQLLGHSLNGQVQFSDLVKGLGRSVNEWIREGIEGRANGKAEIVQACLQDNEVFVQVTLSRIVENGDVLLMAVMNDATELKTLEAQFVQSQKMQAIGQLAGGVAHDFNNLLTAISGYCDLLLLRHDEGDPDFADLMQIHQNANRAASLVGQLLAFSRKQNLQPEVLDLRDTLSDLTHLLNRLLGEKVALAVKNAEDLALVRVDKRQLEQVLINLVVNARDAMKSGGEVVVTSQNLVIGKDLHRDRAVVPKGAYVSITVKDSGSGIAPDKLSKIFEPFFTTKKQGEGTGLGLSTAYGIIKQTGGFIFVDSAQGQGSTFTVMLPAMKHPAPAGIQVPKRAAKPKSGAAGGVILLVEDEAPVRAFAARALKMRGYSVIEAADADQALKILQDPGLKVDVFVTDIIMPGKDGPTWVREARKNRPDTRVVFVSGYAEESFSRDQAAIPNSVFLPKPFSLTELSAKVQEQIQ